MSENDICVDWGCENGFFGKKAEDFKEAKAAHERMCHDDPTHHKLCRRHLNRMGTHEEYFCECGFRYDVDCS